MADPLHQFKIEPLIDFGTVTLPVVGEQQIAFTNSHLAMTIAFGLVILFLQLVTAKATVVPGRMQSAGETLFGMIDGIVDSIIGHEGRKLFPFVFTVFTFILAMNFIGLFLTFTATSQIAVTATFGVITILLVLAIGFAKHGLGFFKLFVPSGVPIFVLPFVVIIEFVSFLLRPITLTLRLFGNMMGGHVALKVFAGFVVIGVTGAVGWLGLPIALLSMGMTVGLTALEFLVAFLQAFVFAVLTCIYLNDVVNLGHGH
ncbi:ATP synthase subunit a [Brevundimonas sp. NIBR10]|jgi:F-type H+-transporting ATPase subunit a|uniref:F0F1 ATP synthase subunit A n=1 Tax=unclassified Brevundimonas TaxID=2622653 RepID=UPI0022F15B0B|nr:F0F1 ATP synthase subunit A [Brevundimonas sp. NIBR10]WGM48157.1 ATP synthase subunit a [Brevundimonas sp. NIBR10]